MTTTTTTTTTTKTTTPPVNGARSTADATAPVAELDLDRLAAMTAEELTELYRRGSVPDSLDALTGLPTCRMLAIRGMPRGTVFEGLRQFAASPRFPWAGKTFAADSADAGTGINRIRLAGGRNWFPFDTRIEPSAIDGKPCILLDYDKPENPWFIRLIRDELREVAPRVFLGPAMLDDKKKPARLVLFFACDNS